MNLSFLHSVRVSTYVHTLLNVNSLSEKIFREINSLVAYLVKPLHSQNVCQKSMRENFRNFHTVSCSVWKSQNFVLTFGKQVSKVLFSRNIFSMRVNVKCLVFLHFAQHSVKITEIYSHAFLAKLS